jgi:hypothetical protein
VPLAADSKYRYKFPANKAKDKEKEIAKMLNTKYSKKRKTINPGKKPKKRSQFRIFPAFIDFSVFHGLLVFRFLAKVNKYHFDWQQVRSRKKVQKFQWPWRQPKHRIILLGKPLGSFFFKKNKNNHFSYYIIQAYEW